MSILHLEVNDSGGWRRVMAFDARALPSVAASAWSLLTCGSNSRLRARIIAPGDTAPLMTWTAADGWKEWRA